MHSHRSCLVTFVLVAFGLTLLGVTRSSPHATPVSDSPTAPLAQFISQGHILSFRTDGILASNANYALRVEFVGANRTAPTSLATTHSNETAPPPLTRVTYPNLWEGISLTYDAPAGTILRSTYTLEPSAQVGEIRLRYNAPITVNADGSLSIAFETGQVTESAPIAWQEIGAERVDVPVQFAARGEREVGFQVSAHNPQAPLVIDPVLTWTLFLGEQGSDSAGGMAVDGDENIYIAGSSPGSWGDPIRAYSDGSDAFAAKLNSSGTLVWNTFLVLLC